MVEVSVPRSVILTPLRTRARACIPFRFPFARSVPARLQRPPPCSPLAEHSEYCCTARSSVLTLSRFRS